MSLFKTFTTAAIAATCTLAAGLAHASTDVRWSVSIGVPLLQAYGQRAPVYVEQAPVYYRPAPQPVYVQPVAVYGRPGYGYGHREPTRWDRDADGVPDRYERRGERRGDRDHDGVPNRHDRRPGDPYRR